MISFLSKLFIFLSILEYLVAYPSNLDTQCTRLMIVGNNMMGARMVAASNQMVVTRNGAVLTSGSSYVPGETLTVAVTINSDPSNGAGQYLFQTTKAKYTGGQCFGQNAYSGY